jgi:S1-C subfamily serine protease
LKYPDKVKEQPHAYLQLTAQEFASLPKSARDDIYEFRGEKIIMFKHGLSGTCFIISDDGHAITNQHVVEDIKQFMDNPGLISKMESRMAYEKVEPRIWVLLDGKQHDAKLVYVSKQYDVAILKIEGLNNNPFFKLKKSKNLERKTQLVTLGFPGSSIASWGNKTTPEEREMLKQKEKNAEFIKDYFLTSDFQFVLKEGVVSVVKDRPGKGRLIEHDSVINGGNSGGPAVLVSSGIVCGVNTWGASSWVKEGGGVEVQEGTFFSIMMQTLKPEIDQFVPNAVWTD